MLNGNSRNGAGGGDTGDGAEGAIDLGWDALPPAVTRELSRSLDPALISQRRARGGMTFSYIEGHVAIAEANRVFGFGGWGYELAGEVTLREIETVDPATGEVRCTRAYSAPVRVTVPGAPPRTDVGFHAVADESADGHETAIKGAVTDGMKRALRSFGDRLGNGLYGRASRRPLGRAVPTRSPPSFGQRSSGWGSPRAFPRPRSAPRSGRRPAGTLTRCPHRT